jgi:hypothetical protein
MHSFDQLAFRAVNILLGGIAEVERISLENLETSARSTDVKNLQAAELARLFVAIGLFASLEAHMSERVRATSTAAKLGRRQWSQLVTDLLIARGKPDLASRYDLYWFAHNALKHGPGESFSKLLGHELASAVEINDWQEGDVSQIDALIVVDDKFVRDCLDVTSDVFDELESIVRADDSQGGT